MVVKVALVVLADTETHADRARVANALTTAYEFKEAGDEVDLIFTGAGTKWIGELSNPDHRLHRAFEMVKDEVTGACKACAMAFDVKEEVQASGIPLLTEYKGHQSLRQRVIQGYQVITF
ncbi:MAG: hypothetical protein AVDCRST_MAG80-167 [uncultured Rubrobacteraceae bacterium]|uniref:Uncharacterized protein n=1 Tax=uncultured Rubrobacteraceae bacterium TaxID=349277 RepID=A0A6J4PXP7_9ACTN|nr:MAG: hypothetical protein AVDCRST_MAG80-167 [uncultured Rubrobacteraceae bacterium]